MKQMIERGQLAEIIEKRDAIADYSRHIDDFVRPQMNDLSKIHEIAEYIDKENTEENRFMRKNIKLVILLYLYAPEFFVYRWYAKGHKGIAKKIAKELGIFTTQFSHDSRVLIQKYMLYGKFAAKVDAMYEKVANFYKL